MPTSTKKSKKLPPLKIENAHIIYKNFGGAAKRYNAAGLRNFHVVLDNDLARKLAADGWNVRWHDPREEGDEKWASMKVSVRFDNYPPRIVMISGANQEKRTNLDEDSVGLIDDAEIENIDMVISPSYWERADGNGIKAYLQKMFVVLSPTDLEAKYLSPGKKPKPESEDDD